MKFLHSNNIIYSDKTFTDGPTHLSSFTAVTNLFSERACVMQTTLDRIHHMCERRDPFA
jgi:DNA replication protein DnaC